MNVSKTQSQIKALHEKIAAEKNDWSKIDQIESDEMLLKNYEQELKEDSEQKVSLPEVAYHNPNGDEAAK